VFGVAGRLHIVATPIGNLGDVTLRAIEVLKSVDLIACEDTRHSGRLLKRHGISARLVPYHDHNKEQAAQAIVALILEGKDVALVTDSGTPGVSDPAYVLVNLAHSRSIQVVPVPGPCAAVAALSASGLPSDRFSFEGFLPRKAGKRKVRLESLKDDPRTLVFYESPHRLLKTLSAIREVLGDRNAVIARELTKLHEEMIRGRLGELIDHFTDSNPRGEFVIVIEGSRKNEKQRA
jgi:16S rRNA (cytidine1402-2'-O)-methyltransferase